MNSRDRALELQPSHVALLEMIDAIDGLGSFHYDLRAGVCRPSRLWTGMLGSPVWPTKEVTSAMRAFVLPEDHHALDAIADAV